MDKSNDILKLKKYARVEKYVRVENAPKLNKKIVKSIIAVEIKTTKIFQEIFHKLPYYNIGQLRKIEAKFYLPSSHIFFYIVSKTLLPFYL